ncbi:MAG TPA: hypothetical protein VHP33_26025 [Polyangiaceae bacterium]|nr:hypothetical protein [Polyangiaceae bacterium]
MKAILDTCVFSAICAAFAFAALGCGDDSEEKKPPTYSTMKPPPQGWKAAVGDGGTLLETFDDASWEVRRITDHDLFAVSCVDNEVGWAVGAQGFVGHTEDGGWSWPAQTSGVTATLRAVSFAFADDDSQVGLAAGDDGTLIATQDGGEHWFFAHATSATLRGTAITEGASLLVAVGDGGVVARSTSRGAAFEVSHIPGAADLSDIALDESGGLALAVDAAGNVWVSRDQAQTFEREYTATSGLEGVALGRSGQLGSAAGAGLALLRSSEGVWRSIPMAEPTRLHATLIGPHEDRAYFAGDDGALLETVDDGRSLFRVRADTHAALRGIEDLEAR